MAKETNRIIAVKGSEVSKWGCPYCGYRSIGTPIRGSGTAVCRCGECGLEFAALDDGLKKSTIGFGDIYPELQDHPRTGTPSHGKPDLKPKGSGEFFRSRGIGMDSCKCFICGTGDRDGEGHCCLHNIAAYVQCKGAGERVIAMFPQGAWLDYREYEPDYVQVKIGACDKHLKNLEVLDFLVRNGVIIEKMIRTANPSSKVEINAFNRSVMMMRFHEKVVGPLRYRLRNLRYWPRQVMRDLKRKLKRN